jgi:hypothetical protein
MTRDEINGIIHAVSKHLKAFMRSERRELLRSALFDIPRRSSLGWECLYRTADQWIAELTSRITPEEIGWRMKRLCARPNFLTLSVLICGYLLGRQQHILDLGVEPGEPFPEDDPERIGRVIEFWQRICRVYREDRGLFPEEHEGTMRILSPEAVVWLRERLVGTSLRTVDRHMLRRLRRMAATLELYAFILHGEQRDGLFAHGPYALASGDSRDVIIVREFTDLQNTYLPWAGTQARNLYSNLALVLVLRDVRTRFDLFGGVRIEPSDYEDRIRAVALLTVSEDGDAGTPRDPEREPPGSPIGTSVAWGSRVRDVPFEEVEEIERCAAQAQIELYKGALSWSSHFKIAYGVDLFANHVKAFFDIAGEVGIGERIRHMFERAAAPFLRRLLAEKEPPSIWRFLATTEGDLFHPVMMGMP